ncbi:hypothetical protein D3C77_642630 [compost metagenome]
MVTRLLLTMVIMYGLCMDIFVMMASKLKKVSRSKKDKRSLRSAVPATQQALTYTLKFGLMEAQ